MKQKQVVMLVIVALIVCGGIYFYSKDQTSVETPAPIAGSEQSGSNSTSNSTSNTASQEKLVPWKTYKNRKYGFSYPTDYTTPPQGSWLWERGDEQTDTEVHIVMGDKAIHALRNHCRFDLCSRPVKERVTLGGIVWEYFGSINYCDVGQCSPFRSVYRTTDGVDSYIFFFEKEDRERQILSTFTLVK